MRFHLTITDSHEGTLRASADTEDDIITAAQRHLLLLSSGDYSAAEYMAVSYLRAGEPITAAGLTFALEDRRASYGSGEPAGERMRLFAPAPAVMPGQGSLI
jgi:hypothetical protein